MPLQKYLSGPLTSFGILVAIMVAVADQVTKLLILLMFAFGGNRVPLRAGYILDLLTINAADVHGIRRVPVGPVLDMVLTWNTGISYGLFPQVGPVGQWALLGVKAVAVVLLWLWLARANSRLTALALGLIIGGAVGNAADRVLHGAVVDFMLFHIGSHEWYVFNLADSAIVAGVIGLLYESTFVKAPQKRPDP
jgi:signal peptidase II